MLLKFALSNYRSFKDQATLDMEACSIKEYAENVFFSKYGNHTVNILKSIALLGANSAGKTNLFKGFNLMRYIVINSAKESSFTKTYHIEPFRLSTETENKPSFFECSMMIDNVIYRYGFKIDNKEVVSEWLYMTVKRREETVFIRTKNQFEFVKRFPNDYKNKLLLITELTRKDALYLSVLAQFNIDLGLQITKWFAKNIIYAEPSLDDALSYTAELLADPNYSSLLNEIIEKSDLGFSSVERQVDKQAEQKKSYRNSAGFNNPPPKIKLGSTHIKYDSKNRKVEKVSLELSKDESSGAQKFIALLGPMIKVLMDGGTFWIDDFDAKIHPYIITMVMDLFNSDKYNQNGAQLVSISYNQQILKKLRRDQIAFLNKDPYGASSITALYIFNPSVRSNAIFDKEYLQGQYGGVPNISNVFNLDLKHKPGKNGIETAKKDAQLN
jgi:AAA15 family ATPase/GTPase